MELSYFQKASYFQRLKEMSQALKKEAQSNNLFKPKKEDDVQTNASSKQ